MTSRREAVTWLVGFAVDHGGEDLEASRLGGGGFLGAVLSVDLAVDGRVGVDSVSAVVVLGSVCGKREKKVIYLCRLKLLIKH